MEISLSDKNGIWSRIKVIHPKYGELSNLICINIETMQAIERHPTKFECHKLDLSDCKIIIEPLK
ncbi:MAG: hypothetical protein WC886_07530 [Saccharofermentanaceae bacterium]|jgi:hypothetical protein